MAEGYSKLYEAKSDFFRNAIQIKGTYMYILGISYMYVFVHTHIHIHTHG